MKISLTLTRAEYKGVATIAQNCCNALRGETYPEVQYRDALMGLVLRMAARLPVAKAKGNRLTLGETESLALWETVGDLAQRFGPYEQSLGYRLLWEIDLQRMERVRLMKMNLEGPDGGGQLTIGG